MICPRCGAQNKESARFCSDCGTGLARSCPSCAAQVRAEQKFCDECGTSLAPGPQSSVGASTTVEPVPAVPETERRVCSVLFVDLVGFTPLSESRDPEEVRELLSRYFEVARTVIARYGGVVEKFIGDAVMAVWGTPTATEGDAERCVRAALDLLDSVAEMGREVGATGLAARAGVVTGEVAVTIGATGQGMVAGDAVNTAARVQAAAAVGTVLVDEGTWRLAQAAVHFEPAGAHELKGKAEPVMLWRAVRVLSGVGGAQRVDGLEAPFVGRDAELRLVKELFHACVERRTPRLVSVTGPAGLGKSRLGWEFEKYIDGLALGIWWHRGRCLSYGEGVAFWALVEMVRQRLDIAEDDPPSVAAEKLDSGLGRLVADPADRSYIAPRLGQLLGVPAVAGAADLATDELFAGWRLFFERLAAVDPVVLLVEDLQHADTGLLDFFEHLLDWARDVPIFVLTLARPELESRRSGWGLGRRNSTTVALDALDESAMDSLLEGLVPGMPESAKATIAGRAEGVPLYAVETVRMLIDRDVVRPHEGRYQLVGDVGELMVPATLQSLLAARLDALDPEARRLVADAAVLGGTFSREALVAVSGRSPDEVERMLATLVRTEVLGVRADPLSPQRGQYGFVQTMLRQVAHDTLSRRERKARHLAVASYLQKMLTEGGEEVAEVVASHLLDALEAVPDDADVPELRTATVKMLTKAGERADRTGAPSSAARAFVAAAELLEKSEDPRDELAAAPLWKRAGAASERLGSADGSAHHLRAAEIYQRHRLPRETAIAQTGAGRALRRRGRNEDARALLRGALAVLEVEPDAATVDVLGELATLEIFDGGDIEAANRLSADALTYAQALGLPEATLADLLTVRGLVHGFSSRPVEAAANFRESARRAEALQDSDLAGKALLNLADVLIPDQPRAAVEIARAGEAHCRRIGNRYSLSVAVANLAHALLLSGDWAEAEHVVDSITASDLIAGDDSVTSSGVLLHSLRGDVHRAVTDLAEAAGAWDETEDRQSLMTRSMAHAAACAASGEHEAALRHAVATVDLVTGARNESVRWGWSIAADAALALGDDAEVERLLDWIGAIPSGHVEPVLRGDSLRVRARLQARRGDEQASATFESAAQALRQFGSPYHLALCLLHQAEHMAREDQTGAALVAAESEEIALRLGARPLAEQAATLSGRSPDPVDVPVVR